MSAEVRVRAAVIDALRADAGLMDVLNGLYDGQPGRAAPPYAVMGECIASDWGAKGVDGREVRLTVSLFDAGDRTDRIAGMLARVEAVVQALDMAGEEWRVAGARLIRSRLMRTGARDGDGWRAIADYRVRVASAAV